jgi:hypothetical protein
MLTMRRLLALLACAIALAGQVSRAENPPIGCYAIGYTPWSFGGEDELAPHRVELRSEFDTSAHADSGRFVSAVPRESTRGRSLYPTTWRWIGRDSISVYWDPGLVTSNVYLGGQTRFALAVSPDTLRGIAESETDGVPLLGPPWAKVVAMRIPCEPSDTLVWHKTSDALSAWGRSQPVDTVFGARHALAAFERLRRQDPGIGPTMFSNLIRRFYDKHGRFPRSAREAYPMDDAQFRLLPPNVFLENTQGAPYRFIPHGAYFDVIDDGPPRRVWRHISASWRHPAASE